MDQSAREHKNHNHAGKSSEKYVKKELILKELPISPGQTLLDAGCGSGYMAKEFSRVLKNTGKVYALDPDENAIANLQKETQGTNIIAVQGDITQKTSLTEGSIDLIYLSAVFHGFSRDQIKGFQKEVKRLLKPQGTLAIVEIKKEPTPFGPPLNIRFSAQELREAIDLPATKLVQAGDFFYMQLFEKRA
jgi:ubiquinone/menaquinone biosynthesis C-methylase UbiE